MIHFINISLKAINNTIWHNKQFFSPFRKIGDCSKYDCAEFKSDLQNFMLPTIFKGKKMKDLCMNKILL